MPARRTAQPEFLQVFDRYFIALVALAGTMAEFAAGMGEKHLVTHDFQGGFVVFSQDRTDKSMVTDIRRAELLCCLDGYLAKAFGTCPCQS